MPSRRNFSKEYKEKVVQETYKQTVKTVAKKYLIHPSQISKWRKEVKKKGKQAFTRKSSQTDKPWRKMEQLIGWIEQNISPNARVELDQDLPDLTSPTGATRQCDIVIRQGTPPRETISIVEVQKRKKSVDINTFGGWCGKMRDVGAQHLICVSEKPFPQSVIDKAIQTGPAVRLVHFTELDKTKWPSAFLRIDFLNPQREIKAITSKPILLEGSEGETGFNINLKEPIVTYNNHKMSFNDLIFWQLDCKEKDEGRPKSTGLKDIFISLPKENDTMFVAFNGEQQKVQSLEMTVTIEYRIKKIEGVCSSYHQVDFGDSVAWVMTADTLDHGDMGSLLELILIPDKEGNYLVTGARVLLKVPKGRPDLVSRSVGFEHRKGSLTD